MPQPALFFPPVASAKRAKRLPPAGVCKIYCVPLLQVEKIVLPQSTAGHIQPAGVLSTLGVVLKPGSVWFQLEAIQCTYNEVQLNGDGGPYWEATLSGSIPGAAEDVRSTLTQLALQKVICIVQFPHRPGRLLGQMEMAALLSTSNTAGQSGGDAASYSLQIRYTAALPPVAYSLPPTNPPIFTGGDGGVGTGGETGVIGGVMATYYYGEKSSATPLDFSQITGTAPHSYNVGGDLVANYTNNDPQYLWIAYPIAESGISKYFLNELDFGPLGSTGSFTAPVAIGGLLYIQSTIPTSTAGQPVFFKHVSPAGGGTNTGNPTSIDTTATAAAPASAF